MSPATATRDIRAYFETTRRVIAEYAVQLRRDHREARLWGSAQSLAELRALMERFVLGELLSWPGHGGPRNDETIEIAHALAHANRHGFLTMGSQPGEHSPMTNEDGSPAECGAAWRQRATVEGVCSSPVLEELHRVIAGSRLKLIAQDAYRWGPRADYTEAFAASVIDRPGEREEHTHFGARLSRRHLGFIWSGIQDHLYKEIIGMHQVNIYDPVWGPETLLWERLLRL